MVFTVYLISINILIPVQVLISLSFFIKIPVPIISIAVLVLFQRSIMRAWKLLNLLQIFPSLDRLQLFLILWNIYLKTIAKDLILN